MWFSFVLKYLLFIWHWNDFNVFYTVIYIDQAGYNTFDEKLQDEIVHWKTFTKKHLILLGFYGKIS